MWFYIVVVGWISLLTEGECAAMGPWEAILDNVMECPESNVLMPLLNLDIQRTGKYTRSVVKGTVNAPQGVNNEFDAKFRVFQKKNGRWEMLATQTVGSACVALNHFINSTWQLIVEKSGVESYSDGNYLCTQPKEGSLQVPFDLPPVDVNPIPKFFYGNYRADILMQHRNGTEFSCTSIYATTVPKQSTG